MIDGRDDTTIGSANELPSDSTANVARLSPSARAQLTFEKNLGWAILALIVFGCAMVLLPFATAFLWSVILTFSTWPLYVRLQRALGGRRTLAALVMSLGMFFVMLLPFVIVGASLADNVKDATVSARRWIDQGPPGPPNWLTKLPVIGNRAAEKWKEIAADSAPPMQTARRVIEPISRWLLAGAVAVGRGLLELALSIVISFFLFRDGGSAALRVKSAIGWIGGERGHHLFEIAGNTVRGVVYGILGTAFVQGLMAGIGLFVAGVPNAGLLALLTFFLSVVPVGPPLIWIPASIWLFSQGSTGWGIFMIVWGVLVSSVDNVVKPWLISQGSTMPFLLILFGVLGGALAFGFIGVFIGPTLLAVGHRLATEWAATHEPADLVRKPAAPIIVVHETPVVVVEPR